MRIVVIESPLRGPTQAAVERNIAYGRAALADSLRRGEAPVASHLLYALPGVFDDDKPDERAAGMRAGLAFYDVADLCVVYADLGVSGGMQAGIERAKASSVDVLTRSIHGWGP